MSEYLYTNYLDYTADLVKEGVLNEEEIYYLRDNTSDQDLQLNFNYVIWNLMELEKELKIIKTIYYFDNVNQIDAWASNESIPYKICISKKLFDELESKYFQKNNLDDDYLKKYSKLKKLIDVDFERAMFQSICMFIYLHELGHILQFTKQHRILSEACFKMNESYATNASLGPYDEIAHLMEIDADYFAVNKLCIQIFAIWSRLDSNKTIENLELMVCSSLAAIFIFFLVVADGLKSIFYSKESDHPHPLIRITYIASVFVDFFNHKGIKLDQTQINIESLKIVDIINKKRGLSIKYIDLLHRNKLQIMSYLQEMLPKMESVKYLTMNTIPNQ